MEEKSWIMVIDDDVTSLQMTEEALYEVYDVSTFLSGDEALKMLRNDKTPNLILLDIKMTAMDGFETYKHIRDIKGLTNIPILFLTGLTGSETELKALELEPQDYIIKPYVRDILLARIKKSLKTGRLLQEIGFNEKKFNDLTQDLNETKREIARLKVLGYTDLEIAQRMNYAPSTVKNYLCDIFEKLDIDDGRKGLRELVRD